MRTLRPGTASLVGAVSLSERGYAANVGQPDQWIPLCRVELPRESVVVMKSRRSDARLRLADLKASRGENESISPEVSSMQSL